MVSLPIASVAIAASAFGGFLVMLAGRTPRSARAGALIISLIPLALSSFAFWSIWHGTAATTGAGYAFYEKHDWIPALGVNVIFGLDGISVPMFWLTALLTTLCIIFSWDEERRANQFFGLLLLTGASVMGVFASLDLFLFYVFWEFTLVPMYFLIAVWGGKNRRYAAIKFFLYTFLASLVMLLAFMALYFQTPATGTSAHSFAIEDIAKHAGGFGGTFQKVVFLALFIGFATKFPVVPLHTWLPDAHVEAPTAGSVMLAGVLLKMGSYGLIRIGLPLTPFGAQYFVPLMFVIAVLSMLYASVICLAQRDYKKLVAYSSIGSMGLVLLGIAADVKTGSGLGLVGANFMMLAHGLISPALFMLCGVLQHNLGTRDITAMGGLADKIPVTSTAMVAFSMAGLGLPGLAAFLAEFQIYAGTWVAFSYLLFIPLLYLVFSAAYYLWALQRAFFGPFAERDGVDYHHVYDIKAFEVAPLAVLFAFTLAFGLVPSVATTLFDAPVKLILGAVVGGA
ncbi:MAG: complex I subunit 4 family protein [Thermoplasmatota archaeon]